MKKSEQGMVMFRNSRKGYDKNDVNRYIEDMNIRFTTAEQQYLSTIRMLENDLERAKEVPTNQEENERMKEEISLLKAQLEDKERELSALKDELTKALEVPTPVSAPEKADVSQEEAESKLGSILIRANLDAQRIVSEAEEEKAKIISDAEKKAEEIAFDAAVNSRLMTENTKRELNALSDEYISELNALSQGSADEYRRLCDELKIKFAAAELNAKAKIKLQ